MHLIVFLLFGLVVGAIARRIVPERESGGWVVSMVLGAAGALLGGFFGRLVGLDGEGQPAGFVMSLVGAVTLVAVYHWVAAGRRLSRN
jgi:uncharacterized membrane protein YeaQ/YmgE (transglycosylase-associated protein family)